MTTKSAKRFIKKNEVKLIQMKMGIIPKDSSIIKTYRRAVSILLKD